MRLQLLSGEVVATTPAVIEQLRHPPCSMKEVLQLLNTYVFMPRHERCYRLLNGNGEEVTDWNEAVRRNEVLLAFTCPLILQQEGNDVAAQSRGLHRPQPRPKGFGHPRALTPVHRVRSQPCASPSAPAPSFSSGGGALSSSSSSQQQQLPSSSSFVPIHHQFHHNHQQHRAFSPPTATSLEPSSSWLNGGSPSPDAYCRYVTHLVEYSATAIGHTLAVNVPSSSPPASACCGSTTANNGSSGAPQPSSVKQHHHHSHHAIHHNSHHFQNYSHSPPPVCPLRNTNSSPVPLAGPTLLYGGWLPPSAGGTTTNEAPTGKWMSSSQGQDDTSSVAMSVSSHASTAMESSRYTASSLPPSASPSSVGSSYFGGAGGPATGFIPLRPGASPAQQQQGSSAPSLHRSAISFVSALARDRGTGLIDAVLDLMEERHRQEAATGGRLSVPTPPASSWMMSSAGTSPEMRERTVTGSASSTPIADDSLTSLVPSSINRGRGVDEATLVALCTTPASMKAIQDMGFTAQAAARALLESHGDVHAAVAVLLDLSGAGELGPWEQPMQPPDVARLAKSWAATLEAARAPRPHSVVETAAPSPAPPLHIERYVAMLDEGHQRRRRDFAKLLDMGFATRQARQALRALPFNEACAALLGEPAAAEKLRQLASSPSHAWYEPIEVMIRNRTLDPCHVLDVTLSILTDPQHILLLWHCHRYGNCIAKMAGVFTGNHPGSSGSTSSSSTGGGSAPASHQPQHHLQHPQHLQHTAQRMAPVGTASGSYSPPGPGVGGFPQVHSQHHHHHRHHHHQLHHHFNPQIGRPLQ